MTIDNTNHLAAKARYDFPLSIRSTVSIEDSVNLSVVDQKKDHPSHQKT